MRSTRSLKNYLVFLLVLILIPNFTACKFNWLTGPSDPNDNDAEKCDYPLSPPMGNVGDTIRSCHFEVTLNWTKYDPIEYQGPRVTIHARIKLVKAKNGQSASIYTDCFRIQDNQGNWYQYLVSGDNELPQVLIAQGQEINGTTTIRVDKNASGFTAMFMESETNRSPGVTRIYADQIKWKLGF